MPQKIGKGGAGPQNYVPAGNSSGGQYGDNETGSNKNFTNFAKPKSNNDNNIGVQIKGEPDTIKPKQKYDGKGKEYLNDVLSKKLSGKNNKITPNGKKLLEQISGADDEYCGIIADLYEKNPQIEIKLGKNLNSKYQVTTYYNAWTGKRWVTYAVMLGDETINGSDSYANGSVFFHESGHALDHTFIDNTQHKSCWSFGYKSKEFNKTLSEMVEQELEKFKDDNVLNELKNLIKEEENKEWSKYEEEYNVLAKKRNFYNQEVMNDPQVVEYSKQISDLTWDITLLKNKFKFITDIDVASSLAEEITNKKNKVLEISHKTGELQRKLYAEKFPQKEQEEKRYNELFDLKFKIKNKTESEKTIAYGDLSDMVEAVTGKNLIGMGHLSVNKDYWDSRGYARGKEAFAEIMSAKASSPESLKVLQKYIPNSLKIFDEIIGEIKK